MTRDKSTSQNGLKVPADALTRVRSEGCVLRRQPLVRNSPLPLTSCYRLEEIIGRGSFGCTVFAATDVLSGVRRVVKCVRKEEPDGIRLWRNEVRILRTLDHPHVLRLFEVFDESEAVYHVTETCNGGDLHQWLDRRLRRRQRHAKKTESCFFVRNLLQQQEQQPECGSSSVLERMPNAGEETVEAASSSSSAASGSLSGGHRSGPSMRSGCPVAAGAAAAAATAAAARLQRDPSCTAATATRPLMREELAARLVAQLLGALRYLHGKGIAHCDVKLENLLLLNELEDSEAGDGQSSDEEEEQLRREEQEEQQQQLLLQQQQKEQEAAAFSRARRGLRVRSSAQLNVGNSVDSGSSRGISTSSRGISTSSSANLLTVVPMVLRKRRMSKDAHEGSLEEPTQNSSSYSLADSISRRDATVKLADFGLARRIVKAKPPKEEGRCCEGTLYYRSPWIVRGLTDGDARSDLWAVGVALFILLTGQPPFNGATQQEVEKAVSETPVSFGGGIWSSISLQCVGFLRALLYNSLLPLHLRGPPPPPPYAQPTAALMLKHPWIQQCTRKERRRGLMRVVSAPAMQRSWRGTEARDGAPHCAALDTQGLAVSGGPLRAIKLPLLREPRRLGHPSRAPSDPSNIQEMQGQQLPLCGDVSIVRTVSDPPLERHDAQSQGASGGGPSHCCITCSKWNCPFGCCSAQQQQRGPQQLRICWGRAPLVVGKGKAVQQQYDEQQQEQLQQQLQQEKRHCFPSSDIRMDKQESLHQRHGLGASCALQAAGVSSLVCIACGGTDPSVFKYEDLPADGVLVTRGTAAGADAEHLQPHLRLTNALSGPHGLESCAAATNAAAAAAAAAAGVAKAVWREAVAGVSKQPHLPLENVPHLHLPSHCCCNSSQNRHNKRMEGTEAEPATSPSNGGSNQVPYCCIVVVDWLTAELFEARVPLLLQACAWLDFARLSPLQRALRSVIVKLMEQDAAIRLVRDVLWVLDPQQSGSVSRQCLLDSLKVVRDFFSLEFSLPQTEEDRKPDGVMELREMFDGGSDPFNATISPAPDDRPSPLTPIEYKSPSLAGTGWTDKGPASPLQAMVMFATLSPGDLPPLAVLEPYCKVLQRALETGRAVPTTSLDAVTVNGEVVASGSSPSEVSTTTGDCTGQLCQLDEALVCLDTDGSGGVEFDEFLAASMTKADFKEREPACSVAFYLLDRNVDGFVSANDLLSILHFDSRSDLQGVLQAQKKRAGAAVAAFKSAVAAAEARGEDPPAGALLDDSERVTGRDEHGELMSVPAGASYILQLEGVTAATAQVYVEVARELKALQHRQSGLWTFEEFMKLL